MFENETLINNLKKIGEKNTHNIILKVDEVDEDTMTITGTEVSSSIQFFNVRIKPISDAVKTDSFILIPAVGSYVYCSTVNNEQSNLQITAFSEVSQIYLKGDANLGLVKITELVDKLNQLEESLNAVIDLLKTHVHPVTALGTPTGTSPTLTTIDTNKINPITAIADLENEFVKH